MYLYLHKDTWNGTYHLKFEKIKFSKTNNCSNKIIEVMFSHKIVEFKYYGFTI